MSAPPGHGPGFESGIANTGKFVSGFFNTTTGGFTSGLANTGDLVSGLFNIQKLLAQL